MHHRKSLDENQDHLQPASIEAPHPGAAGGGLLITCLQERQRQQRHNERAQLQSALDVKRRGREWRVHDDAVDPGRAGCRLQKVPDRRLERIAAIDDVAAIDRVAGIEQHLGERTLAAVRLPEPVGKLVVRQQSARRDRDCLVKL
jgi:hypothetical protein